MQSSICPCIWICQCSVYVFAHSYALLLPMKFVHILCSWTLSACTVFILFIMSIHLLMLVAFICFIFCRICCTPLLYFNLSIMAAKYVIKMAMKTEQHKSKKPEVAEKTEKPTAATLGESEQCALCIYFGYILCNTFFAYLYFVIWFCIYNFVIVSIT